MESAATYLPQASGKVIIAKSMIVVLTYNRQNYKANVFCDLFYYTQSLLFEFEVIWFYFMASVSKPLSDTSQQKLSLSKVEVTYCKFIALNFIKL